MNTFTLLRISSCVLWMTCAAGWVHADDLTFDFRGRPYDPKQFRPTGSNHKSVVQSDARGLRIYLPADHPNPQPVGLVANTGVQGDFEITMEFEFVQVEKPTGSSAGVSIYLTTASTTNEAATIGRSVLPNGAQVLSAHRATTSADGKREHRGDSSATEAMSGKLRLVRTGKMLSYQFAPADADVFREFCEMELGDADLESVRFAAAKGRSPTVLDVRIGSVSITGGGFGEARPPAVRPRWLFVLAVALLTVAFAGAGYWFWSRNRSATSRKARPNSGVK